MHSGKAISVSSLILFVVLAICAAGCSDDKATTPQPTEQDLNYTAVTTETDEVIDNSVSAFGEALEIFSLQFPVDTAISVVLTPEPDSINSDGNWWVAFVSDLATSYSMTRVDSIQFRLNGIPQDGADGANQMSLRHHFRFELGDTSTAFRNREAYASFEFTGLNTTTATINGMREVEVQSRITYRGVNWRRNFQIEMNFVNVTVPRDNNNWTVGCPSSGTITGTVELVSQRGDSDEVASTWEYEITFVDGVASATVTNGTITRTHTRTLCQL